MKSAGFPRLVGDVGGTNARFAWQEAAGAELTRIVTSPVDDFPSLQDAIAGYLEGRKPVQAAIGIANPVTGDLVQMTNHHWSFSIEATRKALGLKRFLVINDFQALALSLPALAPHEKVQVGGGAPVEGEPLALIGPGTGLGVSGLLWSADQRIEIALDGEGGHVSLPAADDEEAGVIALLRRRFGHVSAERALSGPGLENLHEALCALHGWPGTQLRAADITAAAFEGSSASCSAAVAMFCRMLGGVAGNLALTLGARGGVYIGGGIVPRLGTLFAASGFRERFEQKGRFRDYLGGIPTYVIHTATSAALIGAARALDKL